MRFPNIFLAERRVNELEAALASSPLFAIRHKSTGRFLPRPPSGQKGGSWVEPTALDKELPRFFRRERDAKMFLTIWCQGPQVNSYTETDMGQEYNGTEPRPEKAKEPRIKDEYEVVEIFWGVKS